MHGVERTWNKVIGLLQELEKSWTELQEGMLQLRNREALSVEGQRRLASATTKARFIVALPRLLDTARRSGGLAELLIPEYGDEDEEMDDG